MPRANATRLVNYGFQRHALYCPSFSKQDAEALWNYPTAYRVLGYAFATSGSDRLNATPVAPRYVVPRISAQVVESIGLTTRLVPSTEAVFAADGTISQSGNELNRANNNYTAVSGGWSSVSGVSTDRHSSPHLERNIPAGGNVLALDGHVEWRKFLKMRVRTTGSPTFWW
jgi:prepilin-type processing-associated H-X9-DG protein